MKGANEPVRDLLDKSDDLPVGESVLVRVRPLTVNGRTYYRSARL